MTQITDDHANDIMTHYGIDNTEYLETSLCKQNSAVPEKGIPINNTAASASISRTLLSAPTSNV